MEINWQERALAAESKLAEIEKQAAIGYIYTQGLRDLKNVGAATIYKEQQNFILSAPQRETAIYAMPAQQSPAVAVQYQSAVSGMWYSNPNAAGEICRVKVGDELFVIDSGRTLPPTPAPSAEQPYTVLETIEKLREASNPNACDPLEILAELRSDDQPDGAQLADITSRRWSKEAEFFGSGQPDSAAPNDIPSEWRVNRFGQIKAGDILSFVCGDKHICTTAKEILNAGTNREEVIYNRKKNHYFITSMVLDGTSTHKHVFIVPNPAITEVK